MRDLVNSIRRVNSNIVVSPILDPDYSVKRLKLYSKWGSSKMGLTNPYYVMGSIKDKIKLFFVRSEFEKKYMVKGFGVKAEQCVVVPLSYNLPYSKQTFKKEPFCLHISLLMDDRKNVKRLIQAAKKYQFKLILGGRIHNEKDLKKLNDWIGDNSNIEYKGYLTKEDMISLYSRAKVFALPSKNDGVGIVAIEAAALGCDIVITSWGGPNEYYKGMASIVDPYNIDDIGKAIMKFIGNETFQPELSEHIKSNFSLQGVAQKLVKSYNLI